MTGKEPRRAGEILAEKQSFDADWVMDDLLEDFTLNDFEIRETGFGDAMILEVERDGETHRVVTWSGVINRQVHKLADDLPVVARVEKRRGKQGPYYVLE